MKVVSVNVGLPRAVQWKGKTVSTVIFEAPVSGRIHLWTLNFDGDHQADLLVHQRDRCACLVAGRTLRGHLQRARLRMWHGQQQAPVGRSREA